MNILAKNKSFPHTHHFYSFSQFLSCFFVTTF